MKIIYAKNGEKVEEGSRVHNPDYYDKPIKGAESVLIYGCYPKIVADYEALGVKPKTLKSSIKSLSVKLEVGITPELQKVIDDAKAECEKVVAENTQLKADLEASRAEFETRTKELGTQLEDVSQELVVVKGEHTAFLNDVEAMHARINELQPKTTEAKAKK